jgi:uncharacterized protein
MAVYIDTSVAVPLFVPEPASAAIDEWFANQEGRFISSDWLITEFASALSLKVRRAEINKKQADSAYKEFEAFTQSGLQLVRLSRDTFAAAAALVRSSNSGLRAGDALHLAAAISASATAIATADANLAKNAKAHGLIVYAF